MIYWVSHNTYLTPSVLAHVFIQNRFLQNRCRTTNMNLASIGC